LLGRGHQGQLVLFLQALDPLQLWPAHERGHWFALPRHDDALAVVWTRFNSAPMDWRNCMALAVAAVLIIPL
jgi:hypothetical protein